MGLLMEAALFFSGVIADLLASRIYDDFLNTKTQTQSLGEKEALELLNGHPLLYPEGLRNRE